MLNEKGVYVYPGHFYDFPHDGFLIVSLICEEKEFQIGLKSLSNAIVLSSRHVFLKTNISTVLVRYKVYVIWDTATDSGIKRI